MLSLNQVTISVTNLAASIAFYKGLGLHQIVDSPLYARFECPGNHSTFSLHVADSVQPGTTVIYFECEELDQTVTDLRRAGYQFEQEPIDQSWRWREAYLRDPDGHRLCLYFAGENRLNPPWRIDA